MQFMPWTANVCTISNCHLMQPLMYCWHYWHNMCPIGRFLALYLRWSLIGLAVFTQQPGGHKKQSCGHRKQTSCFFEPSNSIRRILHLMVIKGLLRAGNMAGEDTAFCKTLAANGILLPLARLIVTTSSPRASRAAESAGATAAWAVSNLLWGDPSQVSRRLSLMAMSMVTSLVAICACFHGSHSSLKGRS